MVFPKRFAEKSCKYGRGYLSDTVTELRRRKSPQILHDPSFLGTMWRGVAQGLLDGRHNPSLTSFWNVSLAALCFSGYKRLARSAIGGPLVTT